MATTVRLVHKDSSIIRQGYFGFSWTTLFFGVFPALFRGDFLTFVGSFFVYALIGLCTAGFGILIAQIAWAFLYNGYYTRRLLEQGYRLADREDVMTAAYARLNVVPPSGPFPAIAP